MTPDDARNHIDPEILGDIFPGEPGIDDARLQTALNAAEAMARQWSGLEAWTPADHRHLVMLAVAVSIPSHLAGDKVLATWETKAKAWFEGRQQRPLPVRQNPAAFPPVVEEHPWQSP